MKKNSKLDDWFLGLRQKATPCIDECISFLGADVPWLFDLEKTPQDSQWHGEGNVKIHTGMVLDELYVLLGNQAKHIVGWKRQALILGAALHDIGKTVQTHEAEVRGRMCIVSPRHEEVGRSYLAFKIMHWNLPFQVKRCVLNLVGEHHMPRRLILREMQRRHYWKLSRQIELELLYFLEVADMRGRICADLSEQLLHMEEFKLFAEEYNVWNRNYSDDVRIALEPHLKDLATDEKTYVYGRTLTQIESGRIQMAEEGVSTNYEHRSNHAHLVVLCGPSGSGKSTFVDGHFPEYQLVSLDMLREKINGKRGIQKHKGEIIRQAKEDLKCALREKRGVVWDATNLRRDFRDSLCKLGYDYHALVTMVVFLLPEKTIFRNNKSRTHMVPQDVMLKQIDSYQFPPSSEADKYLIVGEGGEELWCEGSWE